MNGEKILSSIRDESEKNIETIRAESEKKCKEILDKAEVSVKKIRAEAQQKQKDQAEKQKGSFERSEELMKRNMLLKTRRDEIDKTIRYVYSYMTGLGDAEYFKLLYRLASTLEKKSGMVFLSEADLKRVPKDFEAQFKRLGHDVKLSESADPEIENGFIIRKGDIEENMSFASIIADRREELEDLISRELFKD